MYKVKCCGVKYFAHQKEKQQHTQCHAAWSLLYHKACSHVFLFLFFFPSQATCRRVAYIGMLPGLSCFKLNSWASTPPPLLATMSQTLTSSMEGEKKHSVQRQRLAAIKCKKKKKWGSCRARADLLTQCFWKDSTNVTSGTAGQSSLLEKELLSGLGWRELVVINYSLWQDGCGNEVFQNVCNIGWNAMMKIGEEMACKVIKKKL